MRKTLLLAGICLLTTLLTAQSDSTVYFFIDYMKVIPGHGTEYVAAEKGVWKSIHEMRKEKGIIDGWWCFNILSPSGSDSEYDFVTVTRVTGWNGLERANASWEEVFSALSDDKAKEAQNVDEHRNLVKSEIIRAEDFIGKEDFGRNGFPSYAFVNYMKVPSGGWESYYEMETTLVKPVIAEEMKHAGGRAGWGLYSRAFPYGADYPYQAMTVDFFDKWSDAGGVGDFMENFKTVYPKMTIDEFSKKIEATRSLAKGEVWLLVDHL